MMRSREDSKRIIDKVIGYWKLAQCQVDLNWTEDVFIRFANNGITTSGYRITQQASISSVTEAKREGNAVVRELTDATLKRGVGQADQLARISQPHPEDMHALAPQEHPRL